MNKSKFYKSLLEAVNNGISHALDGDDIFDGDNIDFGSTETAMDDSSVYSNHAKLYGKLRQYDVFNACKSKDIKLSFAGKDGDFIDATDIEALDALPLVHYVRFSTDEMTQNGEDNSIVINRDWRKHFNNINFKDEYGDGVEWQAERERLPGIFPTYSTAKEAEQDFSGYAHAKLLYTNDEDFRYQVMDYHRSYGMTLPESNLESAANYLPAMGETHKCKETVKRKFKRAYLPSMGQLRFMTDNLNLINNVLSCAFIEPLTLDRGNWWSSSETTYNSVWYLHNGETRENDKMDSCLAFPLFKL